MNMSKIFRAAEYAAIAHREQIRKGTDIPYISHPVSVALYLLKNGCGQDVIIAGLLHDVLEDTRVYSEEQIRTEFGDAVCKILDQTREHDKSLSWEERKRHTLEQLPHQSMEVKLVALADKYHNLCSIEKDRQTVGEQVWKRFNRGKNDLEWYYRGVEKAVVSLEMTPYRVMLNDYRSVLSRVFSK